MRARDRLPVPDAGAAQRIGAEAETRPLHCAEVHDAGQVVDVRPHVVAAAGGRGRERPRIGQPLHARVPGREERIGAPLDPAGHGRVGGAAVRRVVLDAPVLRRIVRRRDDDPVGSPLRPAAVVGQDGVRDDRRRRRGVALGHEHLHSVRGQHLERGALGRLGQAMGVLAEEERAGDSLSCTVLAGGLDDRQDVGLVEAATQGRTAVARGPEGDALERVGGVWLLGVVGVEQPRDVDERRGGGRLPGERVEHVEILARTRGGARTVMGAGRSVAARRASGPAWW